MVHGMDRLDTQVKSVAGGWTSAGAIDATGVQCSEAKLIGSMI